MVPPPPSPSRARQRAKHGDRTLRMLWVEGRDCVKRAGERWLKVPELES